MEEQPRSGGGTSPSSVRLSQEARRLQRELARHLGISQKAVLELAIRALAKQEGILGTGSQEERARSGDTSPHNG